jgi:NAD(P)-dependent dehydrogenase (short-subunit alcohol dehydrogenase family)
VSGAGRIVLVTGGASGIGWAAARRFAADGDRVVIADIDGAAAEQRATELGPAHGALQVDMGEAEGAARVVRDCTARWGRLDVLVNNAGVIDAGGTQVVNQPIEALRRLLAINLLGIERASIAAHAAMRTQDAGAHGERGIIVNLASGAALRAIPLRNGYSASKAGIVAVTRAHGCAWARDGIRVNALAPGYTRTDLVDELIRRGRVDPTRAARRIPLGRMAKPEEMAACIAHLAAPAARATIGSLLIADGGSTAYGGSEDAAVQRGAAPTTPGAGRRVFVVAGISTQLGAACARALAEQGDVVGTDAGDATGLRDAIDAAAGRAGRLDGLVNAAGTDALSDATSLADALEQHLEAHFLAAQQAGRIMLAQGFGAVVNLTSTSGQLAGLGPVAGSGAAAAVGMLTRTMACEWAGSGIRVNALAAGPIAGDAASLRRIPLGRPVDADAVAETAAFLLSADAGYVTGTTLTVDGGLTAYAGPDLEPVS